MDKRCEANITMYMESIKPKAVPLVSDLWPM